MSLRSRLSTYRLGHWGLLLLMLLSSGLMMVGLFSWQNPTVNQLTLREGEIAPFDIVAPRQFSYESALLTDRAQQRAADAIPDQYDVNEGRIRRQQVSLIRQLIDSITQIRTSNDFPDQRIDALLALPELTLSELALTPEQAQLILELTEQEWQIVSDETPLLLDRVMREEIRQSSLQAVRQRVPMLLNTSSSEAADSVIISLTKALIQPNSFFNEAKTNELRQAARNEVPVQSRTYERGEAIIRAGDRTSAEVVEALAQLNATQNAWDQWVALRAIAFTLILLALLAGGMARLRPQSTIRYQELALLVLSGTIWLLAAKFMITSNPWLPYFYPLAALGMLVSVMVNERIALLVAIVFGLAAHFLAGNNPQLVVYLLAGTSVGILALVRVDKLNSFLWAGLLVAITNLVALLAFRATSDGFISSRLAQMFIVSLGNGIVSAGLAFLGYFLFGNIFGITTSLQLNELSRPTHPLLRQLQLKAPGTYFHTILVSNMAERAAAAIGADALLTRVGAYYHDIGKTTRPYFFIENILDGSSPHEKLDPLTSAQIIISHVTDGLSLAHKYRLPQRIQDFIREHHGESIVRYFYSRAQRDGNGEPVNEADFRYPGPNPHSKETGILLLADSCEAAVRARRPANREELNKLIDQLVGERIAGGELNNCDLTLREVQIIREVFQQVLQGVHHPRINYPENEQKSSPQPSNPVVLLPPAVTMPPIAPNNGNGGHETIQNPPISNLHSPGIQIQNSYNPSENGKQENGRQENSRHEQDTFDTMTAGTDVRSSIPVEVATNPPRVTPLDEMG